MNSNQRTITASMLAATVIFTAPVANSQTAAGAKVNNGLGSSIVRTYRASDLKTNFGILDIAVGDIIVINAPDTVTDWMTSKGGVLDIKKAGNRVIIGAIASSGSYPLLIVTEDATYYFQVRLTTNRGGNMRNIIIQPDYGNSEEQDLSPPAPTVAPTGQKPGAQPLTARPLPAAPIIGNASRPVTAPLAGKTPAANKPAQPAPVTAQATSNQPAATTATQAPVKAAPVTKAPQPAAAHPPQVQPSAYLPPAPAPVQVPVVNVQAASKPLPIIGRHGTSTPVAVQVANVTAVPAPAAARTTPAATANRAAAPRPAPALVTPTVTTNPVAPTSAATPVKTIARPSTPQNQQAALTVADIPALPLTARTPGASTLPTAHIQPSPAPESLARAAAPEPAQNVAAKPDVELAWPAPQQLPAQDNAGVATTPASAADVAPQGVNTTISFRAVTNGTITMLYYKVTNNGDTQITFNEQALQLKDNQGNPIGFTAYNDVINVAPGATYRGHVAISFNPGSTIMASLLTSSLNGLLTARTSSSVALEALN